MEIFNSGHNDMDTLLCIDCQKTPRKVVRKNRIRKRCENCIINRKLLLSKSRLEQLYLTDNKNATEIGKLYNVNNVRISRLITKYGIPKKSISHIKRKYPLNENFFDVIDSEEKAYFLGFLYADGYNNLSKNTVSLTLQSRDISILEQLSKLIYSNRPLLKDRCYSRLSITSKHISNKLQELGCKQAKTHTLEFPKWLDKQLLKHFIRGYFDGDGCVTSSKDKYNKNSPFISITGRNEFLQEIQNILISELNFRKTKFSKRHKDRDNDIYTMFYGGRRQLEVFYNWLYRNSKISLERKQNKLKDLVCR